MPALNAVATFFQDNGAIASDVHQIMITQWIIAGFFLLVLLGLLVGAIVIMGLVKRLEKKADDTIKMVEAKTQPLIAKTQEIMGHTNEILADLKPKIAKVTSDLEPKIASVSSDVERISALVRSKVEEAGQTFSQVNSTVQDVNSKSKAQVARVNGMVSDALTTTEHVSRSIQHGIKVPIQKITGWVAAAKSGIESLSEKIPFLHHVAPPMRPSGSGSTAAAGTRPGSTGTVPSSASGTGAAGTHFRYATPPSSGAGLSTPAGSHTVRPTGTAEPGGPPFVPAPDAPKR